MALGVLGAVIALSLVVAVLAPGAGYLLLGVVLPLRVLGLLAGVAAVLFGARVLQVARRGAGGRGAGLSAVALGLLAAVGVLAVVPLLLRSAAADHREGREAAAAAGPERPAEQDVRIDRCVPSRDDQAAYLTVHNSTDRAARYSVYVEVLDASGGSRGLLLSAGEPPVEPGQSVQVVATGSVAPGTAGSCRVATAERG